MNTTTKYGGYTAADLREFIAHSKENGESIDAITGDDATSANVIRDLLDALASDAAQAPEGWKLVPVEPTPLMRKAAADAWLDCGSKLLLNKAAAAARAAINAAPNMKEES